MSTTTRLPVMPQIVKDLEAAGFQVEPDPTHRDDRWYFKGVWREGRQGSRGWVEKGVRVVIPDDDDETIEIYSFNQHGACTGQATLGGGMRFHAAVLAESNHLAAVLS